MVLLSLLSSKNEKVSLKCSYIKNEPGDVTKLKQSDNDSFIVSFLCEQEATHASSFFSQNHVPARDAPFPLQRVSTD